MAGGGQQNVYSTSAQAMNMAGAGYASPAAFGQRVAGNMNPFQQQVTNNTMADMERQRQMQMNNIGAAATQANAFGGSRHGVAESLTNEAFAREFGNMSANMNMQNFNNAQNLSMQQLGGLQNTANQAFGFGNSITQQQQGQGAQLQALAQALIDSGKGQFAGYANAPGQSLQFPLSAIGAVPVPQTQTTSSNPGLFGYLTAGASLLGGLCWVAREVYGQDDPKWQEFRLWLLGSAPGWLFRAYDRHGEGFARVVRKMPVLRRILRPLMDRARRSIGFE